MLDQDPTNVMDARCPRLAPHRRIALLGFARTYSAAPFDDPTVSIWGMNELYKLLPRWDVWFELHDTEYLGKTARVETPAEPTRHLNWLRTQPVGRPIYMIRAFDDIPACVAYPLNQMCERFGRYFTSTVGYMLAVAIADLLDARRDPNVPEDGEWIGLYGIDLASDTEYQYQRPNAEYLIGYARGKGIAVDVPEEAAVTHAANLYGFEKPIQDQGAITEWFIRKQLKVMHGKSSEKLAQINTLDGVIQAYGFIIEQWEKIHTQADPVLVLRQMLEEKKQASGQSLADWNVIGGVIQAYAHHLQIMEFTKRGVYIPETDPFYVPSTSEATTS